MSQQNNVLWLSVKDDTPARGYWDQVLLERLFYKFNHTEKNEDLEGAIVVIPGAYQGEYIDRINEELNKLKWCVVFITSDEENKFPIDSLKHDNMRIFANYPNDKYKNVDRWIPIGPARSSTHMIQEKTLNWAFSGQITHPGREAYAKVLREREDGELIETKGFAQGLDPSNYHLLLGKAKVVPAPSGPLSPDSFRLYEAIEAGAVPIPHNPEFWSKLFKNPPFPIIEDYEQLNGYIDDAVSQYPALNNKVQSWWIQEQQNIRSDLMHAISELAGIEEEEDITVIIPTSPIKSHPDTKIIDETIDTIRHHLRDEKIIITFDGVREENEDRRDDYEEFKRRMLWRCTQELNMIPMFFENHTHQVGMARKALEIVTTPLILYAEQDTPLTPDMKIDWDNVFKVIKRGQGDVIRFHFESHIPKEHEHMMIGKYAHQCTHGVMTYMRTCQWSQRPHVASTAYYRRILNDYFSEEARSFIEDKMHSVVHEAYLRDGIMGWQQHQILIYLPDGNIKRSYHTDGREGEDKFDKSQIF